MVANGIKKTYDDSLYDPFKIPKEMGIFRLIDSGSDMTTEKIIKRIIDHR